MAEPKYYIFDARYRYDVDRAIVMDTADTLGEALAVVDDYGDAVIVDSRSGEIVEKEEA